jgi:hypothetical protein
MACLVGADGSMLEGGRGSTIHLLQRIWCLSNEAAERDGDGGVREYGGASVVAELAYWEERVGV